MAVGVNAAGENIWKQDQKFEVTKSAYIDGPAERGGCTMAKIVAISSFNTEILVDACIIGGAELSIARFTETPPWPTPPIDRYGIKKKGDIVYHVLEGVSPAHIIFQILPTTNYLLVHNTIYDAENTNPDYALLRDAASAFQYDVNTSLYNYDTSNLIKLFSRRDPSNADNYANVVSATVSKNGRFMLAYVDYRLVVTVDLLSAREKVIGKLFTSPYGSVMPYAGAISEDGRYAYIANQNYVYYMNDTCGEPLNVDTKNSWYNLAEPCELTSLIPVLAEAINYEYSGVLYEFSNDNTVLKFVTYYIYSANGKRENIEVKTQAHSQSKNLQYLALGDSYTSGEGDISRDGTNYYSQATSHVGGCHLSSRSYPYLLQQARGIDKSSMTSVACSGALLEDDMANESKTYLGQGLRLAGKTNSELADIKTQALNNFTPGILPQLDFVRKYQPDAVTIMGGGNDVGFAEIIKYCATINDTYIKHAGTCDYVLSGSDLNKLLLASIKSQYDNAASLITRIKTISPSTKIYIIGYPKFLAAQYEGNCKLGAGFLNLAERRGINNGTGLLNIVLKKVAFDHKVNYINVEDSLAGGRMCEKTAHYVTDLNDLMGGPLGSYQENMAQAFHPNAEGHLRIANSALQDSSDLLVRGKETTYVPAPVILPNQLTDSTLSKASRNLLLNMGSAKGLIKISAPAGTFKSNTRVELVIHSREAKLGYVISEADGSIKESTFQLPKGIDAGQHVVVARSFDAAGKTKIAYQFIMIENSNLNVHHGQCQEHSAKPNKSQCVQD